MSIAGDIFLGIAVLAAWLAVIAFVRLRTPFERLHVVSYVNVTTCGAVAIASAITDGATSRTVKCVAIWIVMVVFGALLTHVSSRALHFRDGERL